jgi:hypothetical protein
VLKFSAEPFQIKSDLPVLQRYIGSGIVRCARHQIISGAFGQEHHVGDLTVRMQADDDPQV